MFARLENQGSGIFCRLAGQIGQFINGQIGQFIARVYVAFGELGNQFGRHARQIAQVLLRPNVVEFLDLATKREHLGLQIEEITIEQGSRFDGKTPCECGLGEERGLIVVGVKRRSGHLEFNPGAKVELVAGDTLIVLGQVESLRKLESVIRSTGELA